MNMLTGGTDDVKPQFLSFYVAESGTDTTTSTSQPIPVLRNFRTGGGRAQVIEVLKVWITWNSGIPEVDSASTVLLSTKNKGTTAGNIYDPDVFAWGVRSTKITTSGQVYGSLVDCVDLTDGNGNGILIGTDNIYAQISLSSTGFSFGVALKVLYRISGASLQEYVGMV